MSPDARRTSRALAAALLALSAAACGGGGGGSAPAPVVRSITPSSGYSGSATPVVIAGDNFLVSPESTRLRAWLDDAELTGVHRVDVHTLHATVPAGLTAGTKTLRVENAFGRQGTLAGAFLVQSLSSGALAATVTAEPATGSVGQGITLRAVVENVGTGTVTDVVPNEVQVTSADGAAAAVTGPDPASAASLAPGERATFTWQAVLTAAGHLELSVSAAGNDAFSGQRVPSPPASAAVVAELPAGLVATISASRQAVNVGQAVALTFTLTNGGEAAARVEELTSQVLAGSASCGAVTPALPVTIPSGESRGFAWSCTAPAAGALSLSGSATGVDVNSSAPLSATPATPAAVEVQAPAALAATLALDGNPTTVSVGQALTARLAVRDTGGAGASVSAVTLGVTAGAAACSFHGPATPQPLAGGGSLDFTWTCFPAVPGTLDLDADVVGADGNTGAALSASAALAAAIAVQLPPGLAATVSATPALVDVGQAVAVTFTVTNGGGARANGVVVTPSDAGTAGATCTAAAPASADVAPGGSQAFTWSCTPSSAGALTLSGAAAGTDANSGQPVTASPAVGAAVTVQTPAALAATLSVDGNPATVSVGQALTMRLAVEDTGGASANVTAVAGTPAAICSAATPAPPLVVTPGAGATFTWTCTPAAAGSLTPGATVAGTDRNTGAALSASASLAAAITVQLPAALTATVAASRATVTVGQAVTATYTVINGGGAAASGVSVAPTLGGTAPATCAAVAPSSATIPAGGTQLFTRTCTPSGAGTLLLGGTAAGTDANSGQPVSATVSTAAAVTVQAAPDLSGAVSAAVASAQVGQDVAVTLQLANAGGAAAHVTAVTPAFSAGTCGAPSPAPPFDVGGAGATVTWTCTPTAAAASATLTAAVTAADANTGGALTTPVSPAALAVEDPPLQAGALLVAGLLLPPDPGSLDVSLALTNAGSATVRVTAVTPGSPSPALSCGPAAPAAPVDLAPGGSETFTWTCAYDGSGAAGEVVVVAAAVAAVDLLSGGDASPAVAPVDVLLEGP